MARVEERLSDGRVLDLIRGWLKADILHGLDSWTPVKGSPQGAVISPLLANIYLDPLDRLMAARGYAMVRYADDFVILTRSPAQAEAALALVAGWVAANDLTLHPAKTRIADGRKGNGFEFLGYRFERGQRHVRKRSLDKLKDAIRVKTRRTRGQSLGVVIVDLNRTLKGWFGYFKHSHPNTFRALDQMIRRRLRAMLQKQTRHRPSVGTRLVDHLRWPNAYFANAGLFALHTAWQTARQSR